MEKILAHRARTDQHQEGGDIGAHLERLVRVAAILAAHAESREDGRHNADAGEDDREQRPLGEAFLRREGDHAQRNGGDNGAYIGFEQICPHARDVAHVIAHVIRDDRRVARIVLRNSGLHLAYKVRAHIRRLRIDAAADARKQRDGGGAEAEAGQHTYVLRDQVNRGNAQQAEADHGHAHHRAAGKGDGEGLVHTAFLRRVRGAHIGLRRHIHAEITGQRGEQRADDEAYGGDPVAEPKADEQEQHRRKNHQHPIL